MPGSRLRALLVVAAALGGCRPVRTAPVAPPGADPSADWAAVLAEVVDPAGYVDYDALEHRREALDRYVAWVGKPRRVDRDVVRHAFLLNAYQALVLFGVLEAGRPASTRDVDGWLPFDGSGFYVEQAFLVDGQPLSLSELFHEQIRERVLDFRDLGAVNGGRASDPPVSRELWTSKGLGRQLDRQWARWVADDARGVRVEGDEAVFGPIFERYAWDLEFQTVGDDPCTIAARYATGAKKDALRALAERGCPRRFLPVDAALNDAATHAGAPPLVEPTPDAVSAGSEPEPEPVEP